MHKIPLPVLSGKTARPGWFVLLLLLLAASFQTLAAQSEARLALVIGNGKYQFNTVLKNPANDAADMAKALKAAGFEVIVCTDAGMDAMQKAVRDFGTRLKAAKGVGLFYYSGHGAQVKGKNYLIPVDQDIADADEVVYKALDTEAVLLKMESAGNALNLVFLDACRNNPFPGSGKSGDRGLAAMKVDLPESVIVYAAEPGKVASDGEGRNSPFTKAMIANMTTPGQDILVLMKRVKSEVGTATKGTQSPRVDQNLSRDFNFYPGTAATGGTVAASSPAGSTKNGMVSQAVPAPTTAPATSNKTSPASLSAKGPDARGLEMLAVEGGSFVIGSRQFKVSVSSFYMAKTEVTQGQWLEVMGTDPSKFKSKKNPVENVSWYDAVQFCNKLSTLEGLAPVYTIKDKKVTFDMERNGFRLPTELEWEFAARGGLKGISQNFAYAGSDDAKAVGWSMGNSGNGTRPVGLKAPNQLGLCDLSGNVQEWCQDWYGDYVADTETDYPGPFNGSSKVIRGGNWNMSSTDTKVSLRDYLGPDGKGDYTGFRVVRR